MSGRAATRCIGGRGCRRIPIIPRRIGNLRQRRGLASDEGFIHPDLSAESALHTPGTRGTPPDLGVHGPEGKLLAHVALARSGSWACGEGVFHREARMRSGGHAEVVTALHDVHKINRSDRGRRGGSDQRSSSEAIAGVAASLSLSSWMWSATSRSPSEYFRP